MIQSDAIRKYIKLRNEVFRIRERLGIDGSDEEDPILDDLDDIWYSFTEEEMEIARKLPKCVILEEEENQITKKKRKNG
jgi:hypothetical protein